MKLAPLWKYAEERERIRLRRERGDEEPWTRDAVLRRYHFTNVRRSDDTGSRYLMRVASERGTKRPADWLWLVYVYRMFNEAKTFQRLGFPDRRRPMKWIRRVDRIGGPGLGSRRHWTYYPRTRVGMLWLSKNVEALAKKLWASRDGVEAANVLIGAPIHVGRFFAGQMVADLAWLAPRLKFNSSTHVPIGAGARACLARLLGNELKSATYYRHAVEKADEKKAMATLLERAPKKLKLKFIDIEHLLCEFQRYLKLQTGARAPHQFRRPRDG